MTTKPDTETSWTTERPQVDGDYFYRWNGQECVFTIALGKIWGGMDEQHPPLKGAEWLGPFTTSDFEQLIRLRKAAKTALPYVREVGGYTPSKQRRSNADKVIQQIKDAIGKEAK